MGEDKNYLSQEKFDELTHELGDLKTVRRKEVAAELSTAKALGDLSENAEYHAAREKQASIEDRINRLENLLKTASIISSGKGESVGLGSSVVILKDGANDEKKFQLVGPEESDMSKGLLSFRSPMGEAMLGKKVGEAFSFVTPSGTMKYKIVKID